jgi:hypothetical protein
MKPSTALAVREDDLLTRIRPTTGYWPDIEDNDGGIQDTESFQKTQNRIREGT